MEEIRNTTLCYIEHKDSYLMLLRNKKQNDENSGKWIGVGGHFEDGEGPEECVLREVYEETGLTLDKYEYRGIVTFVSDQWGTEIMHLYTASEFSGELKECNEGTLEWIPKNQVMDLNLWPGDRAFLKLLFENSPFFEMELIYKGEELIEIRQ